jgi:hypothetical protein
LIFGHFKKQTSRKKGAFKPLFYLAAVPFP